MSKKAQLWAERRMVFLKRLKDTKFHKKGIDTESKRDFTQAHTFISGRKTRAMYQNKCLKQNIEKSFLK